ncbi:S8 family serine peptidase [Bacillus sp. CLL-7-23]|uniref:S8 family serine peptidase n=1 Tax=Bacillus changyiensis TaxID=3004103 RepID=A0ABT4X2S1_9BACI|nr:S8 family serine peptidase [Bacillus changyiensis]MDA7026024.1 S8 family serine peptidase [Bacillus changyiensis]
MKNFWKILISVALFFSTFTFPFRSQADEKQPDSEVIVVYKNQDGKESALESAETVEQTYKNIPAVAVTADEETVQELEDDPDVLYVEENVSFTSLDGTSLKAFTNKTSDNGYSFEQWNLTPLQVQLAWSIGVTGKNTKVAVIDSGISPHDDLTIAGGVSTVGYTSSYRDDNGHGTHVAGIIGAKHNSDGIDGVAPDVQLYAVKALDKKGTGDLVSILKGIDWSIQHGINIINMSLGTTSDSKILHDALDKAYQKGIILVAASGNDGNGKPVNYPAAYNSVIAVSATNEKNRLASFSNTGAAIEFSAPGTSIISTYLNQQYAIGDGTSQATPHVTGMLALLKQQYPTSRNTDLRTKMQNYVSDLGLAGRDQLFGYGLIRYKNNVMAFAKAEQAVKQAEKNKRKSTITTAKKAVDLLPSNTDKQALKKRLDRVIEQLKKVAASKVKHAEKYKKKTTADAAQKAINELYKTAFRTNLQNRLNMVRSILLKNAKKTVSYAERKRSDRNISKAQTSINQLHRGKDKTKLQSRLNKVKKKAALAYNKKVTTAKIKVRQAERSRTKKNKYAAQSAVNKLKKSAIKTQLRKRLNAIKLK